MTAHPKEHENEQNDLSLRSHPDQGIRNGEIGGAIELWSSPEGLPSSDVHVTLDKNYPTITGDPEKDGWIEDEALRSAYAKAASLTREKRSPFGDTNDPKVTIHRIQPEGDGGLALHGRLSRYFVLWGLPVAAEDVWKRGIRELKELLETDVTFGNSTHNMLLVRNSKTGELMLTLMAVSARHGFAAGKLTPTCEHQQHPDNHARPVDAVIAGFKKEFGLDIPETKIRLHGVAVETRSAYVCTIHIADMSDVMTEQDVINAWENKPSWRQGSSLLFVPVDQLSQWKSEEIPESVWSQAVLHSNSEEDALVQGQSYKLHHTGPLRISLLEDYLYQRKKI